HCEARDRLPGGQGTRQPCAMEARGLGAAAPRDRGHLGWCRGRGCRRGRSHVTIGVSVGAAYRVRDTRCSDRRRCALGNTAVGIMSHFFKALEQAERERLREEQAANTASPPAQASPTAPPPVVAPTGE